MDCTASYLRRGSKASSSLPYHAWHLGPNRLAVRVVACPELRCNTPSCSVAQGAVPFRLQPQRAAALQQHSCI